MVELSGGVVSVLPGLVGSLGVALGSVVLPGFVGSLGVALGSLVVGSLGVALGSVVLPGLVGSLGVALGSVVLPGLVGSLGVALGSVVLPPGGEVSSVLFEPGVVVELSCCSGLVGPLPGVLLSPGFWVVDGASCT